MKLAENLKWFINSPKEHILVIQESNNLNRISAPLFLAPTVRDLIPYLNVVTGATDFHHHLTYHLKFF